MAFTGRFVGVEVTLEVAGTSVMVTETGKAVGVGTATAEVLAVVVLAVVEVMLSSCGLVTSLALATLLPTSLPPMLPNDPVPKSSEESRRLRDGNDIVALTLEDMKPR